MQRQAADFSGDFRIPEFGERMTSIRRLIAVIALLFVAPLALAQDKPNILVIWGDDVSWSNISAYNLGMMSYETPTIDRIANEGALFTHYYSQQRCTAGRSSFVIGDLPAVRRALACHREH
jgi:arylsulfatase